jgi:hypothetical protein
MRRALEQDAGGFGRVKARPDTLQVIAATAIT